MYLQGFPLSFPVSQVLYILQKIFLNFPTHQYVNLKVGITENKTNANLYQIVRLIKLKIKRNENKFNFSFQ